MNFFLVLAYLFFIGSILGWFLELFYRKFFSKANPQHKWINPGFCVGPYVPLYGFGLCILFLMAHFGEVLNLHENVVTRLILFSIMAISMTAIEYIAGIISLKMLSVRLWDYSKQWGNIQGIICPKFSFYWAILGAFYYFIVHPKVLSGLEWFSKNLAFSFVIGFFFGVFTIDVIYSAKIISKIRKFAIDNDVIVKFESLKSQIKSHNEKVKQKTRFLFSFKSNKPLIEYLIETKNAYENKKKQKKTKIK